MEVRLGVKPATYEDGTKLSDVMTWNNYGTETIPPRPVFQIAAEKIISSKEMKKHIKAYFDNYKTYIKVGRREDIDKAELVLLTAIGSQSIAEARRIINSRSELQGNAPSTVAKKGFDKPLYETGLMIKNLGFEVTE